MFDIFHSKIRKFYSYLSKFYTSLIFEHPIVSIICYLLLIIIFGFGLFQIKFNLDNENLSFVRNSEKKHQAKLLKEVFPQNQNERYFQHQLNDLGLYIFS